MILQEKLDLLSKKYNVTKKPLLKGKFVVVDKDKVPLLPWRNERKYIELKSMIYDGTLHGVSVVRACRIAEKGTAVDSLLYREFDLCQWLLKSPASEIMVFKNGSAANAILRLQNGVVCTIEVAAVLAKGTASVDKHEIIAERGTACDMAVDTQSPQHSVYLYTDTQNPKAYTDVDFELFGLTGEETAVVRQAFDIARIPALAEELKTAARQLDSLILLAKRSAKNIQNIMVGVPK